MTILFVLVVVYMTTCMVIGYKLGGRDDNKD